MNAYKAIEKIFEENGVVHDITALGAGIDGISYLCSLRSIRNALLCGTTNIEEILDETRFMSNYFDKKYGSAASGIVTRLELLIEVIEE